MVVWVSGGDKVEKVDEEVVGFGVAGYGEEGFSLILIFILILVCVCACILFVLAGLEDDFLEGGGGGRRRGVEV